jgi:hypothetical protein
VLQDSRVDDLQSRGGSFGDTEVEAGNWVRHKPDFRWYPDFEALGKGEVGRMMWLRPAQCAVVTPTCHLAMVLGVPRAGGRRASIGAMTLVEPAAADTPVITKEPDAVDPAVIA